MPRQNPDYQAVYSGRKARTKGGLTKNDLKLNKDGKIVSKARSNAAKKAAPNGPAARRGGTMVPRAVNRRGNGLFAGLGSTMGLGDLGQVVDDLSKVTINRFGGPLAPALLALDPVATSLGQVAGTSYQNRNRRGRGFALPGY